MTADPVAGAFSAAEIENLRAGGTSLAGRVTFGAAEQQLYRRGVGRLWPDLATLTEAGDVGPYRLAVDGYLVRGDRLLLGDPSEARDLAAAFRRAPAALMAEIENGCCNLVAHDPARRVTVIANDETGCLPLLVHRGAEAVTFANDLPGLFALVPHLTPDPVGRAELYWFGYQIGERTQFRDVTCILPGTIMTIDWRTGSVSSEDWRRPRRLEIAGRGTGDLAADVVEAMRVACRRLTRPERRYAIKMSGGMDSRLIAGCVDIPGLQAFSFMAPGAIEGRISRKMAAAIGAPFSVTEIHGDFYPVLHAPILIKHGVADCFHQSLLPAMQEKNIDCVLDGLAGDVMFGGLALKRKGGFVHGLRNAFGRAGRALGTAVSDAEAAELIFSQIRVPDAAFPVLKPAAMQAIEACRAEVLQDIARDFARCEPGAEFQQRYVRFAIRNRMRRHVALQGAMCRPEMETLYPFLDRDLQALAARIGWEKTAGKRFYRELYRRHLPRIRAVPFVDSLLPPSLPGPVQVLGRIARFGMERSGYRLSVALGRDIPLWRINCVQWPRWVTFDTAFMAGVRRFMSGAHGFDDDGFAAALKGIRKGTPPSTGTRLMLTASYLGMEPVFDRLAPPRR
jgi:asparagine synthetase B (glutamine-hydrolysing)